jgi:hypothetical protein
MGKAGVAIVAVCVFLATFVVAEVVSWAAHEPTPHEIQEQIEKEVAQVKPTLPKDEGDYVTWFDIDSEWQTIVYKYKIHADRSLVVAKKKDLEAQIKGSMLLGAAKMMMPKGVKTRFELYDNGGSYIYALDAN